MSRIGSFLASDTDKVPAGFFKPLKAMLDKMALQLNQLTEGSIVGVTNAQTSAPTTGDYQPGDFVKNSNRSELGTAGSLYILDGWECATSDPLTWYERRFLTGN
jgi:hypothetical protein